jgi:hypothetical protein
MPSLSVGKTSWITLYIFRLQIKRGLKICQGQCAVGAPSRGNKLIDYMRSDACEVPAVTSALGPLRHHFLPSPRHAHMCLQSTSSIANRTRPRCHYDSRRMTQDSNCGLMPLQAGTMRLSVFLSLCCLMTYWLTVSRKVTSTSTTYPIPGGITGLPCSWGK